MADYILETRNLTKHYGGIHALEDASFTLTPGEHIAVVGDNGAGKSTFVRQITGVEKKTAGQIFLDGKEVNFVDPLEARSAGIETVFQNLALADDLDVPSNLFLGREIFRFPLGPFSWLDRRQMRKLTVEALQKTAVKIPNIDNTIRNMSGGQRQCVAIARAAAFASKLVIMDEPTAALGVQETAQVENIIRGLKERGIPLILVSHNLRQVFNLVEKIWVFRRGRIAGMVETSKTDGNEVVSMITGVKSGVQENASFIYVSIPVNVEVRADRPTGPYRPIWNWVGYDEPNYTYTDHGKKLLRELAALSPEPVRVRTHNLLTSGDGTAALKWGSTNAYTEDADGNPVYDWTIIDRIFDAYVEAGVAPFIQAGFTPEALSSGPGPYRHAWGLTSTYTTITTGWAAPPNDLGKWGGLIEAWARHLVERYGRERVETWPWECWNEPDGHYWTGTIPEFCAMYDATVAAVRRVLPEARVGGPHTCGAFNNEKAQTFLRAFLTHVVETGVPLDFVGFHAKGQPAVHDGHVRMGLSKQLLDIATNLDIINEFPALRGIRAVIGESDPEGCAACSARVHPQNAYRNGPLYGVYWVESMMRTYELSRRARIEIDGAVTWAFMFDGQPWFDGFRDLATNGVDKAVLNAFRMMGKLGGDWVEATSDHALTLDEVLAAGVREKPAIAVAATRDDTGVSILLWHYHDDDVTGPDAEVAVTLDGWGRGAATLRHFRMDAAHSNAFAVWREMGSPQDPDAAAYRRLEIAGQLAELPEPPPTVTTGRIVLKTTLPRQGVSLLRLE